MSAVFFLSAVSSEFHHKDPTRPMSFESYRDVLTRSLRRQIPGCHVIVQEELKQGYGDLLRTLDDEVRASTVVIHLIGDVAGAEPEADELRRLRERHPEFLEHEPGLRAAVADADDLSYTQWEVYLAFHHKRPRLVFVADGDAPRSPRRQFSSRAMTTQQAHLRRLEQAGEHREPCHGQSDLAVKTVVAVERHGMNPTQPTHTPDSDKVAAAEQAKGEIVAAFVANLRQSVKTAVTDYDPAGIEAYLKALDPIVTQFGLTRQFVLNLIAAERDARRRAAEAEPTAESLSELAFAELALGHYHDAMVAARQAIEEETKLMSADPARHDDHRDRVLSGHLLWKDAAEFAGLRDEARRALEAGGRYLDRDHEPVLWADFHEELAKQHLKHARLDAAEELIDAIIDIREEHQPEPSEALANSLLVWCRLLYARANYQGMLGVARRTEQIFAAITPPRLSGITSSCNDQALALDGLAKYAEAEPLYRRVHRIFEDSLGPTHPNVGTALNNLASLLRATNRPAEAEPLYSRALAIDEASHGPDHPDVAIDLNNLAELLRATNRPAEAEPLYRRALAIDEASHGPDHPTVGTALNNLAGLLRATNRPAEAEPLYRRALAISEASLGPEHPQVATVLNNLAGLLRATNCKAEAEHLLGRMVRILHSFRVHSGHQHPNFETGVNNYGSFLMDALGLTHEQASARIREVLGLTD